MPPFLWSFLWITGFVQPVTQLSLMASGYSLDESLAASGVVAVIAAEIAVRLLQDGAGGAGGTPALGPAHA